MRLTQEQAFERIVNSQAGELEIILIEQNPLDASLTTVLTEQVFTCDGFTITYRPAFDFKEGNVATLKPDWDTPDLWSVATQIEVEDNEGLLAHFQLEDLAEQALHDRVFSMAQAKAAVLAQLESH